MYLHLTDILLTIARYQFMKASTILIFLQVLIVQTLIAQSKDQVVQKIRDRYYRINGASIKLDRKDVGKVKYYFEQDLLSIAKVERSEGRYEYYYHQNYGEYHPYFVYFEPKSDDVKPLRAYYDDRAELVLYKEGDEELKFGYFEENPTRFLKQDAYNALNYYSNSNLPEKLRTDPRVSSIWNLIKEKEASIVTTDTVNYYPHEDGGSGAVLNFLDQHDKVIKKSAYEGGEHGGSILTEYFSDDELLYSIHEHESWVGFYSHIRIHAKFYENGIFFREDIFDTEGHGKVFEYSSRDYHLKWFEVENVIPRITYR